MLKLVAQDACKGGATPRQGVQECDQLKIMTLTVYEEVVLVSMIADGGWRISNIRPEDKEKCQVVDPE